MDNAAASNVVRPMIRQAAERFGRLTQLRWRQRDYRSVFSGEQGRRVLADLYKYAGLMAQSHVPGDPLDTAFREGARRVALRIAAVMEHEPTELLEVLEDEQENGYGS